LEDDLKNTALIKKVFKQIMLHERFTLFFFKILFIYLTEKKRERAQAGGSGRGRSRLPAQQGARCGVPSQDPGFMT